MRIRAEYVLSSQLNIGDMFSVAGPEYWETDAWLEGVGASVWIHTGHPQLDARGCEVHQWLYRITIHKEDK